LKALNCVFRDPETGAIQIGYPAASLSNLDVDSVLARNAYKTVLQALCLKQTFKGRGIGVAQQACNGDRMAQTRKHPSHIDAFSGRLHQGMTCSIYLSESEGRRLNTQI
jgi:hypothetical protein